MLHTEINLDELEPLVNGPFSPDISTPVRLIGEVASKEGWPIGLKAALVGSCTNSSYEDLSKVADLCRQATSVGLKVPPSLDF